MRSSRRLQNWGTSSSPEREPTRPQHTSRSNGFPAISMTKRVLWLIAAAAFVVCASAAERGTSDTSAIERLPSSSLDDWKERRVALKAAWLQILGNPPAPCALDLQVISRTEEADHVRTL